MAISIINYIGIKIILHIFTGRQTNSLQSVRTDDLAGQVHNIRISGNMLLNLFFASNILLVTIYYAND